MYVSLEMGSLLREFQWECTRETEICDNRKLEETDYIFCCHGYRLPTTPTNLTWRLKLILKKRGLPTVLDIYTHTFDKNKNASS